MPDPANPLPEKGATPAEVESGYALKLVPFAKAIMDHVRGIVPEGVEFAVLLVPPGKDDAGLRRVVAMSTNRERMAFYAAQWALDIHTQRKDTT